MTVVPSPIQSAADETDPWLAGDPPTGLYFTRSAPNLNSGTIYRAAVVNQTPTFDLPQQVVSCTTGICGAAVTTSDEHTLLYATWPSAAAFLNGMQVQEVALTNGHVTSGQPIPHPELTSHYPSWISANGCQIVVANGAAAGMLVATRAPQ